VFYCKDPEACNASISATGDFGEQTYEFASPPVYNNGPNGCANAAVEYNLSL